MASITIRDLEDDVTRRLRDRAARHGRTMEEEAREILTHAVAAPRPPSDLGRAIRDRFAALGGVQLTPPDRGAMRPTPDLE